MSQFPNPLHSTINLGIMNTKQLKITGSCLIGVLLLLVTQVHAQNQTVSGVVVDGQTKNTLPGVNILVKRTSTGTSTNSEGNYELTVESLQDTLIVSFIGYQTQEVPIDGRTEIDITLNSQTITGEEMVVVGYGQQERSDVTGSVSSVTSEELNELPITSVDQGLQGRAAGVMVTQSGTKPGSGASVRIRGNRSITASNEPLYVIDGVPISGGLRDINPASIQSIEVLKDASATAIYGSRGSNGVVIVTTHRGHEGDLSVTYDGSVGFSKALSKVDRMNGEEYAELNREAFRAAGQYENDSQFLEPGELEKLNNGEYVDYQDMMLQTGIRHNHNLGISGGNETTTFYLSAGGLTEQGILEPEDFSRYNIQVNLDVDLSDKLSIGTTTLGSYSIRNGGDQNFYSEALDNSPLGSPFDEEGNLVFQPIADGQRSNPLLEVLPETYVDEQKRQRVLSNIYGEYQLTDNLSFQMNFAPDLRYERNSNFQASRSNDQFLGPAAAQKDDNFIFEYTWENIAKYQQALTEKHSIELTGLFSTQLRQEEPSSMEVRGIPIESMRQYNFGAAQEILGSDSEFEKYTIVSTMLRANYNYDDRYLLTATGRVDGSSRFGDNNKYGLFPSAAFSWNISNESFFNSESFLNNLKLRISWGRTGQTGITPYQTLALLGRTTYNYGDDLAYGYEPSQIANPDLKWETTATTNLGLDFDMFNSRITASVDVYQQNTNDLLLERQLPPTSGYASILENIGSTRNTGIEVSLSTRNIQGADSRGFQWSTDLNFSSNREEIVELYGGSEDDVGNEWFIGEPINVIYNYDQVGVWQADEEEQAAQYNQIPGEIRVADQNDDGQINAADRTIIGQELPKLSGGMTNRFSYKGVDLSIFLYANFGNTISSGIHDGALVGRYNNQDVDYWTPDNPVNRHPRPTINREFPIYNDARSYYDGGFIKVRNVQLAYNFPVSFVDNILGAQSFRMYVSADQPLILSPYVQKYGGIDPENPGTGTPARWQMNFGINLTF